MPDNVTFQATTLATPPAGTKVSSDENATSGQLQRVKLAYSADGVDTHIPADAGGLLVNLGANNDVTVASLPLPTGAATSALQTQPGVDIGDVTVNNAAGASAVNIQDGGNVITVDGTVSVSEPVSVDDNAGSLTVDAPVGTPVNVKVGDGTDTAGVTSDGNLQTITPDRTASGAVSAFNEAVSVDMRGLRGMKASITGTWVGTLSFEASVDGGSTWTAAELTSSQVYASVSSITANTFAWGSLFVSDFRVRASAWTSGSASVALAATSVPSSHSLQSLSGVATPAYVGKSSGPYGDAYPVYTASLVVADHDGASEFVKGDIDGLFIQGSAPRDNPVVGLGNPLLIGGRASTAIPPSVSADGDAVDLWTTRTGALNVADGDGSLTIDGTVAVSSLPALPAGTANIGDVDVLTVPSPLSTAGNGTAATAHRVTIASDSTGQVAVASIAAGDNNIGNVDVVSLPALAAGTANIGDVDVLTMPNVTLAAGTNTNEVVGDVAFDIGASGNPVLVGSSKETMADSAPANRAGTDGDVERFSTADGALFVIPTGPQTFTLHVTGVQTGVQIHAAPGAGLSCYITSISFSIGAATASSIKVLNNGGADFWGPHYLEAINGRGMHVTFLTPLKGTANTRIDVTTTGAATQTVDINGFIAPG